MSLAKSQRHWSEVAKYVHFNIVQNNKRNHALNGDCAEKNRKTADKLLRQQIRLRYRLLKSRFKDSRWCSITAQLTTSRQNMLGNCKNGLYEQKKFSNIYHTVTTTQ